MRFRSSSRRTSEFPAPCSRYRSVLLSLLALVTVTIAGCDSKTTSEVTTAPTPAKCQLTVAGPPNVVADGGTGTISVTAQPECAWTVSTQASWLSQFSPASGQGNGTVAFRADPNPAPSTREAEIVVNDSQLRVMQEAAPCRFSLAPETQSVAASASNVSVSISVLNGCAWTARSNAEWLTITSRADGNGSGTLTFRVAANGGGPRTGTLTIGDRTHTVSQQQAGENPPTPAPAPPAPAPPAPPPPPAPTCTYEISPASLDVAATGGAISPVAVTAPAGCNWTAAVNNASWITITSGANGSGNGSVAITIAANTGAARTGTVTIASRAFTVTQAAPAPPPPPPAPTCTYEISTASLDVAATGGAINPVAVTAPAGCNWTAAVNNASWITITSGTSGSGNGSVAITIAANTGAARTGTVTIASRTFTVTQAAPAPPPPPPAPTCTYEISPASLDVAPTGGPINPVAVTATAGCNWTAAVNNASWITITSGASGSGNGSVAITIAANTGAARTGTVTIATRTFTVTQAAPAPACTYQIDPTSNSVSAIGATGSITVKAAAGCAWTATKTADWITFSGATSGSGNGSVGYVVLPNIGSARSSTISIGGQTFTVSQAAPLPTCTYKLNPEGATVPAAGGTGTFTVTAPSGCAWTAVPTTPQWITITSGASGNGNGTVAFSAAANSGARRSGTIVVAGETFTITQ